MSAALDLDRLTLARGNHADRDEGVCLLEAVAWWAGEEHTDRPQCVSPVLATYGHALNDALDPDQRQRLIPLIPLLVGTVDPERDQADGLRCAHWLVTQWLPARLDLVPARGRAAVLRGLPVPDSWTEVARWRPMLDTVAAEHEASPAWTASRVVSRVVSGAASGAAWDHPWSAVQAAAAAGNATPTPSADPAALYIDLVTQRQVGRG